MEYFHNFLVCYKLLMLFWAIYVFWISNYGQSFSAISNLDFNSVQPLLQPSFDINIKSNFALYFLAFFILTVKSHTFNFSPWNFYFTIAFNISLVQCVHYMCIKI